MKIHFECKFCQAKMAVDENDREVLCPWCGTLQALPRGLADPDRARRFERANHQFRNGDFERAKTSYERILDSDPTDAEAYWSLVLCRFGVEYVVDEGKYVSTIRRMPIGGSIYSDEDYKSAIHYATDAQARFYECEAARINEIQAGFYALFNREMLSSEGVHTFFAAEKAEQKTENDGAAKSGASVQPVQPTPVQPPKQPVQPTPAQPPRPRGVLSKSLFQDFYMANYAKTTEICFLDSNCVEFDQKRATDLSEAQNRSVLAYMQGNTLRILGPGGVRAPEDCSDLFRRETEFCDEDVLDALSEGEYKDLLRIIFQNCFDTSDTEDMSYMFQDCSSLTSLDVSSFDTSNVADMRGMFDGCSSLTSLDVSSFDTSNVEDMCDMFSRCSSLTSLDVSSFDTSNVEDMRGMFDRCSSLTSLDVSDFDTSNVEDMCYMFDDCSSLTTLDLSDFDTSNVISMTSMFSRCRSLTSLNVSGFDTSNVTDMRDMFNRCFSLTALDISGFDTSNATDIRGMFGHCFLLTSLDVSSFDTSNVTNMSGMFDGCSSLSSLDISGFDTSNVTNMCGMFDGCSSLASLDVSGFDTSNVTDIAYMFRGCPAVTPADVAHFDTSRASGADEMF